MNTATPAQAEAMVAAERERWRAAIAPEIPADMKDWHENSPDEWPEVAAAVLRSRREDAETAWGMLAEWREREKELMRWKSTHAPRLKALEGLWHAAQREADASREAVATLASERAANALLTDEVERLRGDVAAERLRWEMVVRAYLTACDESWAEVCELAAKHGVTSVQIGPKQAAGMTALAALREFCGPNAHIDLAR